MPGDPLSQQIHGGLLLDPQTIAEVKLQVNLRQLTGPWLQGWALDKHTISSTITGHYPNGYPIWDTKRPEAGEALFRLKYRFDWSQVEPLAAAMAEHIFPRLPHVGLIVPMPASKERTRQPVTEVAELLGAKTNTPVFTDLLRKANPSRVSLKDLKTKQEKTEAIGDGFSINPEITNEGKWNVLLVDDLFDTGASAEAACKALSSYQKVGGIYLATMTWR